MSAALPRSANNCQVKSIVRPQFLPLNHSTAQKREANNSYDLLIVLQRCRLVLHVTNVSLPEFDSFFFAFFGSVAAAWRFLFTFVITIYNPRDVPAQWKRLSQQQRQRWTVDVDRRAMRTKASRARVRRRRRQTKKNKRKKTRREIIFDLIKGYFTCSKIQWTMFGGARTKSKRRQPTAVTTTTPMMIGKTVYDIDHPRSIE